MDRLRRRFPHTLQLVFAGAAALRPAAPCGRGDRTEVEIAYDFVRSVRGTSADQAERDLLHDAFEHCRQAEAAR
jgi:exonuclease SbcD